MDSMVRVSRDALIVMLAPAFLAACALFQPEKVGQAAQYNGQFDKIEVPIELQASLAEPLRIWGKEALSLSVDIDLWRVRNDGLALCKGCCKLRIFA